MEDQRILTLKKGTRYMYQIGDPTLAVVTLLNKLATQ
jgi:hypothetical protein